MIDLTQELPDIPCVNCGSCCRKAPCVHGSWDAKKQQCAELVPQTDGEIVTYICGGYERISKHPDAWFTPAFGAGCCQSLFNEARQRLLSARKQSRG
jgi:hypothetical protein